MNDKTIQFQFEETGEDVNFTVLSSLDYNDKVYLLVVPEEELECEQVTAYILKAVKVEQEDVIYEIVDDEDELTPIMEKFSKDMDNFELDV